MEILPKPEDLKKPKQASVVDYAKERIAELAEEENSLVSKINGIKDNLEVIKKEFIYKQNLMLKKHSEFVDRLSNEVASLEHRKKEALSKIVDRTPEFNKRDRRLNERETELDDSEEWVESQKRHIKVAMDEIERKKNALNRLSKEVKRKNRESSDREEKIKLEELELEGKKTSYKNRVIKKEVELRNRENMMLEAELSNRETAKILEKISNKQSNEQRRLVHAYRQLQKTRDKILGKK